MAPSDLCAERGASFSVGHEWTDAAEAGCPERRLQPVSTYNATRHVMLYRRDKERCADVGVTEQPAATD